MTGPDFAADLRYGPAGSTEAQLLPLGQAASFRSGAQAGYFVGGGRTIPGIPGGSIATLQVEVWYLHGGSCGIIGRSSLFHVTLTSPPATPAPLLGLQTFACGFAFQTPRAFIWGDKSVAQGGLAHFAVADIAPYTAYQWQSNGLPIPGATNSSYTITNAQFSHAGVYAVAASNGCGVLELTTTLTVLGPTSPLSQTAEVGGSVHFLSGSVEPPAQGRQWLFGGYRIAGATSAELRLTNLQFTNAGAYQVIITNAFGVEISAPAFLNVIALVPRRLVPGIMVQGEGPFNLDAVPGVATPNWSYLDTLSQSGTSQWYFDAPVLTQRFYRAWQTNQPGVVPALAIHLVPELSLTGAIGSKLRLEGIDQFGPTGAWYHLQDVLLTNSPQFYHDTSAVGQPPRFWRTTPSTSLWQN